MNERFSNWTQKPKHIASAGILIIALCWVFDAAIDSIALKEKSFLQEMIAPSFPNFLERIVSVVLILLLIIYVKNITRNSDQLTVSLHEAMLAAQVEEARAEGILGAIGDGVSIQDTEFRILYQNDVHKNLVGGDFTGQYCYSAYNCLDRVCPDCPVATCFRDGTVHKVQKPASTSLTVTHIEITASPLRDAGGNIIAGIELLRDISESKQAEERLKNSEMRFRNLVESTYDWVWEVDAQGRYTYSSPQVFDLLGYDPAEVMGKTPFDFMPPDEVERVGYIFRQLVAGNQSIFSLENANLHKDGHPVVLETNGIPFFNDAGALCGYRGTDRDISERKQTEIKIRNLNEKLAQRATQLAVANKELEAFSYSVSHDLRAPLTRISSAGQILREEYGHELGEEGLRLSHIICEGCEDMDQLVEDLLRLSRVASHELHLTDCDFSTIAWVIAAELQLAEPDRQTLFTIAERVTANADSRLVKVLLENLLGNAWKYTKKTPDARIEFGVMESEGERVYYIRDNGAGFDMGKAQNLFKPFKRLHDAAEFKGTGIGLATVQRIVDRHGGRVWGEGIPDHGATFYFTLT